MQHCGGSIHLNDVARRLTYIVLYCILPPLIQYCGRRIRNGSVAPLFFITFSTLRYIPGYMEKKALIMPRSLRIYDVKTMEFAHCVRTNAIQCAAFACLAKRIRRRVRQFTAEPGVSIGLLYNFIIIYLPRTHTTQRATKNK